MSSQEDLELADVAAHLTRTSPKSRRCLRPPHLLGLLALAAFATLTYFLVTNSTDIQRLDRQLTLPRTQALKTSMPPERNVQIATFIFNLRGAPSCHANSTSAQQLCNSSSSEFLFGGTVGPLRRVSNDSGLREFQLTHNRDRIRVASDGIVAIDAQVGVRVQPGVQDGLVTGAVKVHRKGRSWLLPCQLNGGLAASLPNGTSPVELACRVSTFVSLLAGDEISMSLNSPKRVQLIPVGNVSYIKVVRLG